MNDQLRRIPSVDSMLREEPVAQLLAMYPHGLVVKATQELLSEVRQAVLTGGACPSTPDLAKRLQEYLASLLQPSLLPVINATGVVIHTNLGRAPLSLAARQAMRDASDYSNLEFDLPSGERGSRYVHAEDLLRRVTGAEAALVVNNAAGAVLLILSALARDREVIISRGQLVEIGGGFRIPDVLQQSGAKLVEVGTTNRTYLKDYEQALNPETAMILHVHTSNYRMTGFVHSAELRELAHLGQSNSLPVVDDLGSGALLDTLPYGLSHEPTVQESLASGVDLVCFSGDKLLGGPQAGLIVGKGILIAQLQQHPLVRALRVSKLVLAGLQATLLHYLKGEALSQVPVWQMISTPVGLLEIRAERLARWLRRRDMPAAVVDALSTIGGGSLPEETIATRAVRLRSQSPDVLAHKLRMGKPAVVARIEDDALLIDPRTVLPWQEEHLRKALLDALSP